MQIVVASGKGGTGKTTVATSLALSLEDGSGGGLGFLDCDVEAPNSHLFLHPVFKQRKDVGILIPDVDETRSYLIQDLLYTQGLEKLAYVKGVGAAPLAKPRGNLTGDPYFTDGLRAVMWVSSDPVSLEESEWVLWEDPAQVSTAR